MRIRWDAAARAILAALAMIAAAVLLLALGASDPPPALPADVGLVGPAPVTIAQTADRTAPAQPKGPPHRESAKRDRGGRDHAPRSQRRRRRLAGHAASPRRKVNERPSSASEPPVAPREPPPVPAPVASYPGTYTSPSTPGHSPMGSPGGGEFSFEK